MPITSVPLKLTSRTTEECTPSLIIFRSMISCHCEYSVRIFNDRYSLISTQTTVTTSWFIRDIMNKNLRLIDAKNYVTWLTMFCEMNWKDNKDVFCRNTLDNCLTSKGKNLYLKERNNTNWIIVINVEPSKNILLQYLSLFIRINS